MTRRGSPRSQSRSSTICPAKSSGRQHRDFVGHEDDAARNDRPQHPACHRALFGRRADALADDRDGPRLSRNCPPAQRDALIDILARSGKEEDKAARNRVDLLRVLAEIKSQGYATATRTRRLADEIAVSVPVPHE